ncbi:MAG: photosynthetic reaction center subunit H [Methylocystis sp.]
MIRGAITQHIDVAQAVLYAFFLFFGGLIWYLRSEDRREGYPLECEATGTKGNRNSVFIPRPKIFRRADGRTILAPAFDEDSRPLNAVKAAPFPGAPLEPIGDPLLAGVGPGAYALRSDETEKTNDGRDLLAPLRVATNFAVASEDVNPVGFPVLGADNVRGGVVSDIWVDRSEGLLRYYEVTPKEGAASVLLPAPFANVDGRRGVVRVEAVLGDDFSKAPKTRDPDKVTLLEEEMITAFYGAGTLYATPQRAEPLL